MKEIKIVLPENKREVKLSVYLRLMELNNSQMSSKERIIESVRAVTGLTEDNAKMIAFNSIKDILDHYDKIIRDDEQEKDVITTFEYKGVKYGLIPNLDDISLNEYIDLEESEKVVEMANTFLNVIYRKIIKEDAKGNYEIESYDDSEEIDFGDLPLSIFEGAKVFFYRLSTDLMTSIAYTSNNMIAMLQKRKKISILPTDGMQHSTALQRETLQNLTMYFHSQLDQFFNLSVLRKDLTGLSEKEFYQKHQSHE